MLPEIHALWIGPHLPPMAAGCLRSLVRIGHKVVLHSYANLQGVPTEVQTADAAAIVPKERIFRHAGQGQYAIFSDYFRYALLKRRDCVWVDCDVYCVRPIDYPTDHLFGYQDERTIAIGVLKLPPDSPVLQDLLNLFEGRPVRPRWITPADWFRSRIKAALYHVPWVAAAPWSSTGPQALTSLLEEYGVTGRAQPREAFYPVSWQRFEMLARSGTDVAGEVRSETRTIHLWNEFVRNRKTMPEHSSFLDLVAREGLGGPPALVV